MLRIDPALATGCRFYKSANGYYLTGEPIGPQAITAVTIRETKERVESEKEGSPPLPSIVLQALLRNQLGGRRPTANAQSSESSHRRAYMALWCLAGVGCPSALNPLSLQPPYLLQELRCPWCSRPPVGGADSCPAGLTQSPAAGTADIAPSPTRSQARSKVQQVSFQSLCTSCCHSWLPVFSSCCVHTHWHTQRRLHGIYKRRPQTQHTHKHSNIWWKSRVGPKSDGPAWYTMKTIFYEPRLGEVRVPPGPPTGGEPNSGSMPRPSQGGKMVGGATPHRITTQGSTRTPRPDQPRLSPAPNKQDGVLMLRPLARTKPIEPSPIQIERVEAPGLPSHFGCF